MWTFRTASPFSNVFSLTNLYSPTALAKIPASVPPLELIPPSSHLVLDGYRLQSDPRTGSSIVDTSHLRTNSVRQEIVPALAPYTRFAPQVAATSSTITRDPDETKQVTNLGLGILSTLQIADPQSFGDIKASELSATIDALRTANITQLISDSPFVQMTENAVGPPASLAHYLKLDQLQTVDYGQMAYVLQLGVKVGAFAALNVASWYGSGFLQKIIQNVINSSELSEGKKHFLTQSAKATRITFVAMAAFFSFILVGGNVHVLLAAAGLGVLGLTILANQFFLDLANYMRIKANSTFAPGNYIAVGDKRGYVLYTNLTHTFLINFYDPDKVDLNAMDGAVIINGNGSAKTHETQVQAHGDTTELAEPQHDGNEDAETPTSEIPTYISLTELAKGRIRVTRQIPNANLLAQPVDRYEDRDLQDLSELEPHLEVLRPKSDRKKAQASPPYETNADLRYLDMHWMMNGKM